MIKAVHESPAVKSKPRVGSSINPHLVRIYQCFQENFGSVALIPLSFVIQIDISEKSVTFCKLND